MSYVVVIGAISAGCVVCWMFTEIDHKRRDETRVEQINDRIKKLETKNP